MNDDELRRDLGDGRAVWLVKQIYTWLLAIGPVDSEVYDDQWEYQDAGAAFVAWLTWNPADEPEPRGWYRHHKTGRRRPGGDPAQEYIHF